VKLFIVAALVSFLLIAGGITPFNPDDQSGSGVMAWAKGKFAMDGTIEEVDPDGLRVTLLTDVGQKASLSVTRTSVLVGLAPGDRVNCELNEDGKVTKIIKVIPVPKGADSESKG
jgi:hypothetical protein